MISKEKFREQEKMRKGEIISRDENGFNILTPAFIQHCCEENGGYHTAHLNTCLYLHYKGFKKIEALEAYTNVRSLWLESNGITEISGLDHLKDKLYMLYLQQNAIDKIENLTDFSKLVCVNLSHNKITEVSGFDGCTSLKNIDLSHNLIRSILNCEHLKTLPALTSLDLRENLIEDHDEVIPFFKEMPELIALYLKGCPAARKISNYRKNMTIAIPALAYLDERPIFDYERLLADAFGRGGKEEEERVRVEWAAKQKKATTDSTEFGKKLSEEGKARRKEAFKKMMDEVKKERKELVDQYWEIKRKHDEMLDQDPEKNTVKLKLWKCTELMQEEWFLKIRQEGDGGDITPEMGKPRFKSEKQFLEDIRKRAEARKVDENDRQSEEHKENLFQQLQSQQYSEREAGEFNLKAGNVVPEANSSGSEDERQVLVDREINNLVNPGQQAAAEQRRDSSPAVSGTSSEDDDEVEYGPGWKIKDLSQVRWSPKLEHQLEDILVKQQFDFKKAAKDFQKHLNRTEGTSDTVFQIDSKTLQLRWTDIEIRRHVIPAQQKASSQEARDEDFEQEDDELPPLEQTTQEERNEAMKKNATSSKLISEMEGSSDEGQDDQTAVEEYNDLEELD